MQQVDWNSSLLEGAAYQDQWALLEVAFRSGAVYHYLGVPAQTYHTRNCCGQNPKAGISTPISGIVSPIPRSILRGKPQFCDSYPIHGTEK